MRFGLGNFLGEFRCHRGGRLSPLQVGLEPVETTVFSSPKTRVYFAQSYRDGTAESPFGRTGSARAVGGHHQLSSGLTFFGLRVLNHARLARGWCLDDNHILTSPYEVDFQPVSPSGHMPTLTTSIIHSKRLIIAQQCTGSGGVCPSGLNQQCCGGLACILNRSTTYPTTGQFEHICAPLFQRGQVCSSDAECGSGTCDNNPSAGTDPTGNNYRLGLCE